MSFIGKEKRKKGKQLSYKRNTLELNSALEIAEIADTWVACKLFTGNQKNCLVNGRIPNGARDHINLRYRKCI